MYDPIVRYLSLSLSPGLVLSMAVDPYENWVALGTSLGYHVVWDMRFQLPIRHWQHSGHQKCTHSLYTLQENTILPYGRQCHLTFKFSLYYTYIQYQSVATYLIKSMAHS